MSQVELLLGSNQLIKLNLLNFANVAPIRKLFQNEWFDELSSTKIRRLPQAWVSCHVTKLYLPWQMPYRKPGPRQGMLPRPVGQSTPNVPSGVLSTGGVTPLSRPFTGMSHNTEPILDAKYFHPTGNGATSQKPASEPPLMSAYFPKPRGTLPTTWTPRGLR